MPEVCVAVERHLAVERDDLARAGPDQWVDLHKRGVGLLEDPPQLFQHLDHPGMVHGEEARLRNDPLRHRPRDALNRVQLQLQQGLRTFDGEGLDVHAAFDAAHGEESAGRPVEQDGEVELLRDVGAGADHHRLDGVALDVEAEDLAGGLQHGLLPAGELHAAGLPTPTGAHLRLDHHEVRAEVGVGRECFLRGGRGAAREDGDVELLEQIARLILQEIHVGPYVGRSNSARLPVHLTHRKARGRGLATALSPPARPSSTWLIMSAGGHHELILRES